MANKRLDELEAEVISLGEHIARLNESIDRLRRQNAAASPGLSNRPDYRPLKCIDCRGYNRETLRLWCEQGTVDGHKVGGRWFVSQASVDQWIQQLKG